MLELITLGARYPKSTGTSFIYRYIQIQLNSQMVTVTKRCSLYIQICFLVTVIQKVIQKVFILSVEKCRIRLNFTRIAERFLMNHNNPRKES